MSESPIRKEPISGGGNPHNPNLKKSTPLSVYAWRIGFAIGGFLLGLLIANL